MYFKRYGKEEEKFEAINKGSNQSNIKSQNVMYEKDVRKKFMRAQYGQIPQRCQLI